MDLLTTPPKANRFMIPGLDTESSKIDMGTAVTYAGLHTPPQSAHESRRPSIQSPFSDTPYSAGGCGFPSSHPTTPFQRIQQSNDSFFHGWLSTDTVGAGTSSRYLEQQVVDSRISTPGYLTSLGHGLPLHPNASQHIGTDDFNLHFKSELPATEMWTGSGQLSTTLTAQTTSLGSELFPMTLSPSSEVCFPSSVLTHSASELPNLNVNFNVTALGAVREPGVSQDSQYNHTQIIVPSQVSPQDAYEHSQFNEYAGLGHSTSNLADPFRFSFGSFNSFDVVGPPSPMEAYFDHTEDEEYQMIKTEHAEFNERKHRSSTAGRRSATSKRRSTKRVRNGKRPWHRHETGGIEVQCEGTKFCLDQPLKYVGGNRKIHVCTFIKKNGSSCGAGFERGEHLKRHAGSHMQDRPYVCPLDQCHQKIQRPDNACDHFKTHLRAPKSGKRNFHVDWDTLRDAIWEKFDDKKKAGDIVKNLEKWIANEMPDAPVRGQRG